VVDAINICLIDIFSFLSSFPSLMVYKCKNSVMGFLVVRYLLTYTLSEAWSGVNWADLMAAQGAFGTDSRHDAL